MARGSGQIHESPPFSSGSRRLSGLLSVGGEWIAVKLALKVKPELAGKRVKCSKRGAMFQNRNSTSSFDFILT
jgi:hypothetical protein